MPVVSSSAALEGVTAHYCGCMVVCLVSDVLLIIVVEVSGVAIIDIVPCVVADGTVFLVFCVMVDAVGLLIVIYNFYIGRCVKSGDFIVKLCFQSVYVILEVTTPHSCIPSGSGCSSGEGVTMSLVVVWKC